MPADSTQLPSASSVAASPSRSTQACRATYKRQRRLVSEQHQKKQFVTGSTVGNGGTSSCARTTATANNKNTTESIIVESLATEGLNFYSAFFFTTQKILPAVLPPSSIRCSDTVPLQETTKTDSCVASTPTARIGSKFSTATGAAAAMHKTASPLWWHRPRPARL